MVRIGPAFEIWGIFSVIEQGQVEIGLIVAFYLFILYKYLAS